MKLSHYLFVCLCCVSTVLHAQKPVEQHALEIRLDAAEAIKTRIVQNQRINMRTGYPTAAFALQQPVSGNTPEQKAWDYLEQFSSEWGIRDLNTLRHHATRTTDAGSVVRYRQYFGDVPVNKSEITISIDPNDRVQMVASSYVVHLDVKEAEPSLSLTEAAASAERYIASKRLMMPNTTALKVYANNTMTRLAYETVILSSSPQGEWHVWTDAITGERFKVTNELLYNCKHHKDPKKKECSTSCAHGHRSSAFLAFGTGYVFNPDPLSSNQVAYGGNYQDNNDATNSDLDAARFLVTLKDITNTAGTYKLEGPWAEIVDTDAPNTGLFEQNSPDFLFNREEQGFEAVNCYWHIDSMMRYVNLTLNCNITPTQYTGGVRFDPHGANGNDNSFYSGASGGVTFGEGCVDDGEDSDVIHHELGHGLHDWVTSGSLSQVNGLSEGCGDYIAQSYNRSLGNWTSADAAYQWVFNWDGHNACWPGRITNHAALYPGGLVGQIHTDGQIWATSLMRIYDIIGRTKTDKIFYEGLGSTNSSSSQDDAANAVYQAAINLGYTASELQTIHAEFTATGYTLPPLQGPPSVDFMADKQALCLDIENSVTFSDNSTGSPTSWLWTFEGGTPMTSTDQNPTITYTSDGTYDVTLIASNAFGSDTITKLDYIDISSGSNCPSCITITRVDTVEISPSGSNLVYESVLNFPTSGTITDVNVTNITGLHTYLGDLTFYLLNADSSIIVQLNDDVCGSDDDFNVGFDDQATSSTLPCPYTDGNAYIPLQSLSAFNGEEAQGDWRLRVIDDANADGGELQTWSLEICIDPPTNPCLTDLNLSSVQNGQYQAANSITSDAVLMMFDSVRFKAGMEVNLLSNFEVPDSTVFEAVIGPCD